MRPLEDNLEKRIKPRKRYISRRSFLGKTIALGAGTVGAGLLGSIRTAEASGSLSPGDAALLRFPAALELIEADFWIQYNELGGIQDDEVPGGSGNPAYTAAPWRLLRMKWMTTSMTTPMMRSLITSSSTLIWSPRERRRQISIRFAR